MSVSPGRAFFVTFRPPGRAGAMGAIYAFFIVILLSSLGWLPSIFFSLV